MKRGRFAPSPTGDMHLGNARTALLAWLSARQRGGSVVLRIEDLDRARVVAGAEHRLLEELAQLGLDWDEGPDRGGRFAPYRQSERTALYDGAIARLLDAGRAFLCACSRADVARASHAPHATDEGPRYPGTCRHEPGDRVRARAAAAGRAPVVRFDGRGERIGFVDAVMGPVEPAPEGVDDFVLRRADGTASYQLAVVVDDAAMGIDEVVRGADLVTSTPRQLALFQALGAAPPRYAHVPLVLDAGGERLAKRTRPASVRELLAAGVSAPTIVGVLAASAGLLPRARPVSPADLLPTFSLAALRRDPATIDGHTLMDGGDGG